MKKITIHLLAISFLIFASCEKPKDEINNTPTKKENKTTRTLNPSFSSYWYQGTAEITSYKLTQERYGELRNGNAVTIFVTEDFLPEQQVKADATNPTNIPVLKLNLTKNYTTGIYPYSLMTSTFSPVKTKDYPIKITHSTQEWCGQYYGQLNHKEDFSLTSHSYFEGEEDQQFKLTPTFTEDEIFNRIRLNPKELPQGNITIIPSFESSRMLHFSLKAFEATAQLQKTDSTSIYKINYPELKRSLTVYFEPNFPFTIQKWEEQHPNGLITTAQKLRTIKSAYWTQNSLKFDYLRDSLLLY